MYNLVKNKKGITLIALVVTIVVLLILAGISINALFGENGILTKAKEAKREMEEAQEEEKRMLSELENYLKSETINENMDTYKSPFQYQLLNSYVIEEIESKLGRKMESTDIFYEVIDENNVSANEVYIYNPKNNIKIKVDKSKLNRTKAVWYWLNEEGLEYFNNETKCNDLLSFLENEKVTEIYISLPDEIDNSKLREFIKNAYQKGMIIEYLTGDSRFISEYNREDSIYNKMNFLKEYNEQSAYNEKIRGIHYDIEVHTKNTIYYDQEHTRLLPEWKDSNSEEEKNNDRKKLFVEFVIKAYSAAKENNLTVAYDVPPLRYAACLVNYNNVEKSIMEYVMEYSDYCSAMAYKNEVVDLFRYICLPSNTEYDDTTGKIIYSSNTQIFSDQTERCTDTIIELAVKYKKNIIIGLCIEDESEDGFSTLGKEYMYEIVNDFERLISKKEEDIVKDYSLKQRANEKCGYVIRDFDSFGFSYHHAIDFYNM